MEKVETALRDVLAASDPVEVGRLHTAVTDIVLYMESDKITDWRDMVDYLAETLESNHYEWCKIGDAFSGRNMSGSIMGVPV